MYEGMVTMPIFFNAVYKIDIPVIIPFIHRLPLIWRQQSEQSPPDFPLPRHFLQCFSKDPKAYIIIYNELATLQPILYNIFSNLLTKNKLEIQRNSIKMTCAHYHLNFRKHLTGPKLYFLNNQFFSQ